MTSVYTIERISSKKNGGAKIRKKHVGVFSSSHQKKSRNTVLALWRLQVPIIGRYDCLIIFTRKWMDLYPFLPTKVRTQEKSESCREFSCCSLSLSTIDTTIYVERKMSQRNQNNNTFQKEKKWEWFFSAKLKIPPLEEVIVFHFGSIKSQKQSNLVSFSAGFRFIFDKLPRKKKHFFFGWQWFVSKLFI